jgi:hypothetical protein
MTWKFMPLLLLPLLIISCDDVACYSPTQGNPNEDRSLPGCPCTEGQDQPVCVKDRGKDYGLMCFQGKWVALIDGACLMLPPPPDGSRPDFPPLPPIPDGGPGPDMSPDHSSFDPEASSTDAAGFCATCGADELCVVFHDGPCGAHPMCRKKTAACSAPVCDDACNRDICGTATCRGPVCPETAQYPTALHCYGS